MSILIALRTYAAGHGLRGQHSWDPTPQVVEALNASFYAAFQHFEPTGKRRMVCLDVSGSMDDQLGTLPITAREAAVAMAMLTAQTEKNYFLTAFTSTGSMRKQVPGEWKYGSGQSSLSRSYPGLYAGISPINITGWTSLDVATQLVRELPMGGTDCALPMLYATAHGLEVDAFEIYTDNETWAGGVHPIQALREYRQKSGIAAKLIVVGMTATEFSIADPADAGTIDVVGFDAAATAIMADFIRGAAARVEASGDDAP